MIANVKFAIIGTGAIAQSYAAAFEKNDQVELVAVADARSEAARTFAAKFGCPWFTSHYELLQQVHDVEAVMICTPPNTHETIAVDCARRGLHVLCEKPFAMSSSSARNMAKEARRAGVLLTMGSKFRYVTDVIKARELVQGGAIGEVVLFENAFTGRVDMSRRWNSNPAISGGGVLIDNGTHSVDIIRYFLGPLAEVHAVEGKRIQNLLVEDTARLFVRATSGIMGNVDLSWSINKELDWYVNVFGSQGVIQVGWKSSRMKIGNDAWTQFGNGYDKVQAFRAQVNNFAGAIRCREQLAITWEDALASVEVMEACYRSLYASNWTGVNMAALTNTPAPLGDTAVHREVVRV